ncbi:MAG: glycoside hydrolase [Clostridiales bacterium]|nr:glycoside hydrolase [Clostridiales bacterium]
MSCEAVVRRAPDGSLLLVCQCGDRTEPAPGNRVYTFKSRDDGNTWSQPALLYPDNGRAVYQTEVWVHDGLVSCFATEHDGGFLENTFFECVSADGGATWDKRPAPVFCGGFVFLRGVIDYKNRPLIPYHYYNLSKRTSAELSLAKRRIWDAPIEYVENGVLIGDGKGNFRRGKKDVLLPLFKDENGVKSRAWVWSEPTVAEIDGGRLVMLLRYDGTGVLYKSFSDDGGDTWSDAERTGIPNPGSKTKLIAMGGGKTALIHTPNPSVGMNYRMPLSLWISDDGLKTFYKKETLLSELPGWYSYPDGFYEDGKFYISFEFNRHDIYFMKVKVD